MSSREPSDALKTAIDGVAGFGSPASSQAHELPASGPERSWLLTGRAAADKRRARGTHKDLKQLLVGQGTQPTWESGVWRDFSDAMERRAATDALNSLAPELREVVRLAYFEGYTNRDLAEVLGLTVGQVRSRLREALSAMHALMRRASSRITSALLGIAGYRAGRSPGWRPGRPSLAPIVGDPGAGTARELLLAAVGTVAAAATGVLMLSPATAENFPWSPPAVQVQAPAAALPAQSNPSRQPAAALTGDAVARGPGNRASVARAAGSVAPGVDLPRSVPRVAADAAAPPARISSASARLAGRAPASSRRVKGAAVNGTDGVIPAAQGTINGLSATPRP